MTETILIVEDESIIRNSICEMLRKKGYEVEEASDGAQAVELIDRRRFDLVISDFLMPKLNGAKLVEHLRSIAPRTPVILLTGFLSRQAAEALLPLTEFVEKPVSLDVLVSMIERVLSSGLF
jgi:DNA-binding NtrC family response regulator